MDFESPSSRRNSFAISKRGLIRTKPTNSTETMDTSVTLASYEIRRLLNDTATSAGVNSSILDDSRIFKVDSLQDIETKSLLALSENNFKHNIDMLFPQFLEIFQSRSNDLEIFDTIQDFIQACSSNLDEILKVGRGKLEKTPEGIWLQDEINTWKLLYCLYKDRVVVQKDEMECDGPLLGASEKEIVNQLYSACANLREYQLIVDWLEVCAYEQNTTEVAHFTDRTISWENTLFQLQNPNGVAFGSSHEIVKHLDPDAPLREKKPLHPLDAEDEARLTKHIFLQIRQGRIEDAKALCEYCGQPWRAAILEGWRLHEDPNYESGNVSEKTPIEGNPQRDIWKKCAWMMASSPKFDDYTRAISGVFCGHLDSLLAVMSNTWEDLLWSFLKVQIDIRVESEIRLCCTKNYRKMPDEYWNSKMSLEQIFEKISVHPDASKKGCVIQKHLILDNISELLQEMHSWIETQKLSPHMLRFLSHIVLFMKQIGKIDREEIADKIIKAYVECLIELKDAQLVAFYTAALPSELQILLYSKFLQTIKETTERRTALEEGIIFGLNVETITTHTVESIRNKQDPDSEQQLQTDISPLDLEKISALEWLTFYPQQRGELLWQANAMIRIFLTENKIESVRRTINMIPNDSITQIISEYGSKDNLPYREECSIKEYLCHQTYLAAIDGFNEWLHLYHNQPKEPNLPKADAKFTERVAAEHKEQTYRVELDRWKMNLTEQSRITKDLLFNILLFPDQGWLIDSDPSSASVTNNSEWENRQFQLENIRKFCIPEIVLLLHKVLHYSGQYKECIRLADELASEQRRLYSVYSNHKLEEILGKIAESSLALLNEKLDPWGYPSTI